MATRFRRLAAGHGCARHATAIGRARPPSGLSGRSVPRAYGVESRGVGGVRLMERMASRAQTVVADVVLAAVAFLLAFWIAPAGALGFDAAGVPTLTLLQLVVLYGALAGGFPMLFRRELSPWRYASIPDALVLARIALLTVGVFLLWVFVLDRALGLPRSTILLAPMFQMVGSMGVRILRRALHEHALE